jgi:arsenate reductase (thioredoxin)
MTQLRTPFKRTRVLFVCVGNSCRSPMAEALARHSASDVIEATSAGISPLGHVADLTRKILLEKGVNASGLESKGVREAAAVAPDLLINMTGIPGRTIFPDMVVEDWDVEDPYGEDLATYRRICEDIQGRIEELAERLRREARLAGQKS